MGGGSSSGEQQKIINARKDGLKLLGSTVKGQIIMNFSPGHLQSTKSPLRFPKYAHAFSTNSGIGYITGGVQQLLSTSAQLKTADQQEYQGVISKKFIKVKLDMLTIKPQSAFQQMPDMINARYAHCAIQHQGAVYVIGGREYGDDQIGILSACEKFQFGDRKWKAVPSLQYPRAGAAVVVYGDHLYVFGGYTGKNERVRVIQSFVQGDTGWRKLPYKLHQGLQGFLTIAHPTTPSSIYIFGGKTNYNKTSSVLQLNFDKSTIQYLKPMKQPRCFHKGFIKDKIAHIIGGGTDSIQCYNLTTQVSGVDKEVSYLEHCSAKELAALSCLQPQIRLTYRKKPYQSPKYKNKAFIFGNSKEPFSKIIDLDNFVVISQSQSLYHNFYKFPTISKVNKQTCFIMGGINSQLTQVTDAVYSFNLLTQQIKYLEPMKIAKYGFSATVKGSYLYVVGGRKLGGDDVAILASCQRFSFQTYQWEAIGPLKYKRHSALLLTVGSFLIAIGGYKGNGVRSNQIEIYIQSENRWVEVEQKFELAAQAMTWASFQNQIYLFGGRAEQIDIQKVFKLNITADESKKYQKSITANLQPVGNLSVSGTNLKVYVDKHKGYAYVFGNVKSGIDVYDLRKHRIVQMEKLAVFEDLGDGFFQSYAVVF